MIRIGHTKIINEEKLDAKRLEILIDTVKQLKKYVRRQPKEIKINSRRLTGIAYYDEKIIELPKKFLYTGGCTHCNWMFVIIHEFAHIDKAWKHNKKFYRRFIYLCEKLNVNPSDWITRYEYKYIKNSYRKQNNLREENNE